MTSGTLRGRTALVTGSTQGVGEAFATAFAAQGCNVVMNGFGDPAQIENLRATLATRHGVPVIHHPADVGKPEEVAAMMAHAQERFGGVDILVNNAVTRHYAPVESFPVDKWDRALAVNLSAAFHTIRLALPYMKARGWGRIINMASIHATKVVRDRVDYMTTKHAIVGLTRAVALETAETGITCNALSPGWILTPHAEGQIARKMAETGCTREAAMEELLLVRQPSRRAIAPADIAAFGVFLCSDAAANISGAALPIDGAWAVS
ncbi:MAG TPA: 3-hydroxybutyrate dehydrogenase [Burkholderiales bacterium]|nr:3-hydroxybutyrate dehydrogenase [Burkholderiales bacterium]